MTEIATVQRIEGELVFVRCGLPDSCASCKSPLCNHKERVFPVTNPRGYELREGLRVQIFLPPRDAVKAGFIVLILPLLLFLAAFGATAFLLPASSEALRVLGGLGGLATGFALVYALGRNMGNPPEISGLPDD